jgi:hypothetical protein
MALLFWRLWYKLESMLSLKSVVSYLSFVYLNTAGVVVSVFNKNSTRSDSLFHSKLDKILRLFV